MDTNDKLIASELKERVQEKFNILDFRVFGSRARGNSTHESDMDVYIVLDELNDTIESVISDIAWEVGFNHDIIIFTLLYSRDEIGTGPYKESPIYQNIMKEGIAL
jgi:uncharacterized protein